jgi:hypothetical protein
MRNGRSFATATVGDMPDTPDSDTTKLWHAEPGSEEIGAGVAERLEPLPPPISKHVGASKYVLLKSGMDGSANGLKIVPDK